MKNVYLTMSSIHIKCVNTIKRQSSEIIHEFQLGVGTIRSRINFNIFYEKRKA